MRKTIKTFLACLLVCAVACGCVSIPNSETVSPKYFRNKSQGGVRGEMEQINFVKLRMDKPAEELLGPNDVLGIYIAGITGNTEEAPPIHNIGSDTERPASGYPYMVRSDGTLSLPMLPEPIYVEGMTLIQAEEAIRAAYTLKRSIVRTDANISVSLIKPRTYHVTVIREDVTSDDMRSSASAYASNNKGAGYMAGIARGTATSLELPAYRNDVLEALSQTGGLPGLNAKNEVVILRKAYSDEFANQDYMSGTDTGYAQSQVARRYNESGEINNLNSDIGVLRIPLRVGPNDTPPQLTSEDVTLYDGDVVYIQSREAEVYYTGGLIKGGVYPIPRDYDLDVMGAIATAGGTVGASAGAAQGNSIGKVGSILPASRILVLREVNGRQYAIQIRQREMLRDPSQRILIEPNDVILVEYTPLELWFNMIYNTINFTVRYSDFK
ncbi:MAG: polysaccharide biosynthesis/export family protein [Thermoguttaceae bacterium]|nr:polysaccharide biosynthesis/export family protein [Thermoguttaceae bacterium]